MTTSASTEPWVVHEDEHVLVVHKPAGVNTHRAHVDAQDGMHEWVQRQRPGSALSILHRLDKGTSGLLLFGRSTEANRSLAAQFEGRTVAKSYELLARRDAALPAELTCNEPLAGQPASTDFVAGSPGSRRRWTAHPHTGRTHQVRAHAAALGLPITGDTEYGGEAAARVFLHTAALGVTHPTGGPLELTCPPPASFDRAVAAESTEALDGSALAALVAYEARAVLFDRADTDAFLWIDRHHDGFPETRVERLGDVALAITHRDDDAPLDPAWVGAWMDLDGVQAIYEQRRPRGGGGGPARRVAGHAPATFEVTELGCRYRIDLEASATSSGLFLDQRETRRRLLTSDLAGRTVLNTFAHTGSFSVAAARAGAETLTLDLSKHYLAWAEDNLRANGLDPADHDAVFGDAFEWMDRFAKKGRTFDLVLVDPPSSSTARRGGKRWAVERDLHGLVERAARLCAPGGTVFVSTNLRTMAWDRFDDHLQRGLAAAGRSTEAVEHQTLPLDHRSGPGDPPYLKAAWLTLDGA